MSEHALPTQTPPHIDALALERELAQLIVKGLNLPIQPEEIDPEAALYGEGLGLDSIDILEIVVAVEQKFGVTLKETDDGKQIFKTIGTIADFVEARAT